MKGAKANAPRKSPEEHLFLSIAKFALSRSKAEAVVDDALLKLTQLDDVSHLKRAPFKLRLPKGDVEYTYGQLVQETRQEGTCVKLLHWRDVADLYFGGKFGVATNSEVMEYKITVGKFSKVMKGPMRCYPAEDEHMRDTLSHRKRACAFSGKGDFEDTCREYRGYLYASIAVLDAFLNSHLREGAWNPKVCDLETAKSITRTDDRIATWLGTFTDSSMEHFKQGPEWSDFMKLRKARNYQVHALEPYHGHSLKDLVSTLNAANKGIGGLLAKMRNLQGLPNLAFIERLQNAPTINFQSRR